MKTSLVIILSAVGLISTSLAKGLYDPVKSYVNILNKLNFDTQVTNNRAKGITIVQFYKEGGKL